MSAAWDHKKRTSAITAANSATGTHYHLYCLRFLGLTSAEKRKRAKITKKAKIPKAGTEAGKVILQKAGTEGID
jgi:hypothetical protein